MRGRQKKPAQTLAGGGLAVGANEVSTLSYTGSFCVSDGSTIPGWRQNGGSGATMDDWVSWLLLDVGFHPKWFMTLTFGNDYSEMPAEWVRSTWKWLVHRLNLQVGGPNYRRKFHHSYFSYVMTLEYQKRGALHIHAVGDGRVDFGMVHHLWCPKFGGRYGFAWISTIPKLHGRPDLDAKSSDEFSAMKYVLKYVLKDSQPIVWLKRNPIEVKHVDLRSLDGPSRSIVGPRAGTEGTRAGAADEDWGSRSVGEWEEVVHHKEKPEGD